MAETESGGDFEGWLTALFSELGLDGDVYGGYISGALENLGGAPLSEVEESLAEILDSLVEDEDERTSLSKKVVSRWQQQREQESKTDTEEQSTLQAKVDSSTQKDPSLLTPPPTLSAPSTRSGVSGSGLEVGLSNAEKKRLIAQYGCESEEEDDEDPGAGRDLFQNVNAELVTAMVKTQKEQQKVAHVAKVERDKKSRETQKQKQEDRKEKEKKRTQKHEKRR